MFKPVGRFFTWFFDEKNIALMLVVFMVGLFLYIIVPSVSSLFSPFGFQTKEELKQTVIDQQKAIEQIQKSNESLETNAIIQQEISKAVIDKAVEIQKQQIIKSQKLASINHVRYKAIQKIHKENKPIKKTNSSKPKHKTPINHTAKKAVSHVQITAIWDTYCLYNSHTSCR